MKVKSIFLIGLFLSLFLGCNENKKEDFSNSLKILIDEGYNNADFDVVDQIVADKYVVNRNGVAETSREAVKKEIRNLLASFKEYKFLTDELFSCGNKVTMRWTFTGKDRTFGKPVTYHGIFLGKFENGLLIEGWQMFDNLSLYKQLGYTLVSPEEIQKKIKDLKKSEKKAE